MHVLVEGELRETDIAERIFREMRVVRRVAAAAAAGVHDLVAHPDAARFVDRSFDGFIRTHHLRLESPPFDDFPAAWLDQICVHPPVERHPDALHREISVTNFK